jgi:predicted DCC family thiol-disulfide oxidoreductase YuxK
MGRRRKDGAEETAHLDFEAPVRGLLLVYDGDCGFCRGWVDRWKALAGERLECATFQESEGKIPADILKAAPEALQLRLEDGRWISGAAAVFALWKLDRSTAWWAWLSEKAPGFHPLTERLYRFIASHRTGVSRVQRWVGRGEEHALTSQIFLRGLGVVWFWAFLAAALQVRGLIGGEGILPASFFLEKVHEHVGSEAYWWLPGLCWLGAGDGMLLFLSWGGVLLSLALVAGLAPGLVSLLLWVFYLSLVSAGQAFFTFQWDALILETGFLALFLVPWRWRMEWKRPPVPSMLTVWLLRLLAVRFFFFCGWVKMTSGDPSWQDLTALDFHYWTQPLPNPVAWFANQFPEGFQQASVAVMLFIELALPFLVFLGRRPRQIACIGFVLLQLGIMVTGNHAFFNWLTLALCVPLLEDRFWRLPWSKRPRSPGVYDPRGRGATQWVLTLPAVACLLVLTAGMTWVQLGCQVSEGMGGLLRAVSPLHLVNGYGVFAVMTKDRNEIVIEGSSDGLVWKEYVLPYKPGPVGRRPPVVAPYQPRLDWQLWFASLEYQDPPGWFGNLMRRLLEGSPAVTGLFAVNPFPETPPKFVRASFYSYRFTTSEDGGSDWWKRERTGTYFREAELSR